VNNQPEQSPLGKASRYADQYDASLLFPIARAPKRAEIGLGAAPPFFGADMWTAFELSWLNLRGKPQVAIAHFTVPCESPNIIESKSFKLYLNSFNNSCFADAAQVQERLRADVNEALWRGAARPGTVGLRLLGPALFDREPVYELDGLDLDPGLLLAPVDQVEAALLHLRQGDLRVRGDLVPLVHFLGRKFFQSSASTSQMGVATALAGAKEAVMGNT
jgi:NADPH-dependent 7-cyano-7-deazaguanine reductase QueF-like protein